MNTPIITKDTCGLCKHRWLMQGSGIFCRRFPPQSTQVVIGMGPRGPQVQPFSGFPPVKDEWTCGEFKPRIEMVN